ncbi:hypothetical protein [Geomobilimonas luticola]|uniref:Uncharacterized protein n=1 Tax=Geomobilimonas luticola TaxID=1114878 RepID=A0ABS5S9G6_9BACT|nr:hypothetical protein [Geomobilimonas luticola]MBT0652012.1 hypothetical protein [Geomobilimonas luticola]
MKRFRPTIRFSALLLLVLMLCLLAQAFVSPRLEFVWLQEHAASSASLTDNDSEEQKEMGDFKPPKHSFLDYSNFFASSCLLPAYNPAVSRLLVYEPFASLSTVYMEIVVPPDSLA